MNDKSKETPMNVEAALATRKNDPGFWREIWQQIRLVYYLIKDPEVPFYLKLIPFTAVIYLLWPIDLITDFAPFFGQLDDLTALLVSSKVFVELAPQPIVAKHIDVIRVKDGYATMATTMDDEISDAIVIDGEVIGDPPKDK
ncbi:MAG: DUF1232 domain-containing protein [Chloroflexi bacterium]|nr:DUF1232 domain-containing protein [Chloroflexota bacterium]